MTTGSRGFSFPLLAAGVLGLSGVALGAMGAHAFKVTLAQHGTFQAWETAARYQLLHAVALLGLAAWSHATTAGAKTPKLVTWTTALWCVGTVLFSGSLYGLALGGPGKVFGPITPVGGLAFMAGWLLIILAAFRAGRKQG